MDRRGLLLTYRDYATLPDDGRRYELHDGALSVTPAPGLSHQRISANLGDVLRAHVKRQQLGEVLYSPLDVILAATTVLQPDLIYLDRRCRAWQASGAWKVPPRSSSKSCHTRPAPSTV